MSKNRFLIISYTDGASRQIAKDFHSSDRCTVSEMGYRNNNLIKKIIRKLYITLKLPHEELWYNFAGIPKDSYDIVLIFPATFFVYNLDKTMRYFRKNGKPVYYLFTDSMSAKTPTVLRQKWILNKVDPKNILSFSKSDCEKYGFHYLNESYYSKNPVKKSKIEYDIYFLGRLKPGRSKQINELYKLFKKHDISAKFDIILPKSDIKLFGKQELLPEIKTTEKYKTYQEVVEATNKANCILEIGQDGQNAPSLRYFEAVTMNKKLLTNIKYTKNLNFYNKKFMKVTDFSEKNMDFNWIKKREKVDYGYKNEFSPLNIIKQIEELENKNV